MSQTTNLKMSPGVLEACWFCARALLADNADALQSEKRKDHVTISAEDLFRFLIKHGLAGVCYERMLDAAGKSSLVENPRELQDLLRDWSIRQTVYTTDCLRLLGEVVMTLHEANVPALIFKGVALGSSVYASPYQRPANDTDILIRREDKAHVINLLRDLGYVCGDPGDVRFLTAQLKAVKPMGCGLEHKLDVHWRCSNQWHIGNAFGFAELFDSGSALAPFAAQSKTLRVPGSEHALLLACCHRAANTYFEKLIWLYDMHLLVKTLDLPALERVRETALTKNIGRIVLDNLELAVDSFNTTMPAHYLDGFNEAVKRRPKEKSAVLAMAKKNVLKRRWLALTTLENLGDKFAYVCETLAPPANYMRFRFQLADDEPVLSWYFRRLSKKSRAAN